jgi:hypothetical protein
MYVENQFARAVLMKPVQQDLELIRRKMDAVIANCCESSSRRSVEQQMHALLSQVSAALN